MGGGPLVPQVDKVECVSKTQHSAFFVGEEIGEEEPITLTYHGDASYFHVGRKYIVTFDPIAPGH